MLFDHPHHTILDCLVSTSSHCSSVHLGKCLSHLVYHLLYLRSKRDRVFVEFITIDRQQVKNTLVLKLKTVQTRQQSFSAILNPLMRRLGNQSQ